MNNLNEISSFQFNNISSLIVIILFHTSIVLNMCTHKNIHIYWGRVQTSVLASRLSLWFIYFLYFHVIVCYYICVCVCVCACVKKQTT